MGPALAFALCVAPVRADSPAAPDSAREIAARVHARGGYDDDLRLPTEEGDGSDVMPAETTSASGRHEAAAQERPMGLSLPWLDDLVRRLVGGLAGPLGLLALAVGLLVVGTLAYLAVRSFLGRSEEKPTPRSSPQPTSPERDPMLVADGRSPDELAAAGLYREAIHALFLEVLGRRGALDDAGDRTAREIVGALTPRSPADIPGVGAVGSLLSMTELVWWGARPASAEQFAAARVLAAEAGRP